MTRFRPCIDLHSGAVKQIVGGTLTDNLNDLNLKTNFISEHPAAYYAQLYRKHNLRGGHVIMLGPGNESAAMESLQALPHGLQIGGGINASNARNWIEAGAEKVCRQFYCSTIGLHVEQIVDHRNILPVPIRSFLSFQSASPQSFETASRDRSLVPTNGYRMGGGDE